MKIPKEKLPELVRRLSDQELDQAIASAKRGDYEAVDIRLQEMESRGTVIVESDLYLSYSLGKKGQAFRRKKVSK